MTHKISWALWSVVTLALAAYFGYSLFVGEDKSDFLIGETSYGHYQIELACSSCHTDAFGGPELIQQACVNCHGAELKEAQDSHPKKKFTDPREAFRLEVIDARYCVSCHTEHKPEQTHAMGVTLPEDYCFHCHQEVIEERASHRDLAFDSCATAGCHNFHDNRALYERFLVENADQPWLIMPASITRASAAHHFATRNQAPHTATDAERMQQHPDITAQWQHSAHADGNVSCSGCHTSPSSATWIESPGVNECRQCHQTEAEGFLSGKHGMRLADTTKAHLAPISPAESPLEFKADAMHVQHGCNSCHQAHEFNTHFAAVSACLQCHNDEHSNAFLDSPHGTLWQQSKNSEIPLDNSVSCATCHLPRVPANKNGTEVDIQFISRGGDLASANDATIWRIEHNQNLNLRPNEKMIRPVCMQCHGLAFSIDALADPALIKNNFKGKPATHIPSVDWALAREKGEVKPGNNSTNDETIQE